MNMTAKQMIPAIGQIVSAQFEQLTIECKVLDVKTAYGNIRLQIEPLSGMGTQWVDMGRIRDVARDIKVMNTVKKLA